MPRLEVALFYFFEGPFALVEVQAPPGRLVTLCWHRWRKCVVEVDSLPRWYHECLAIEERDEYMAGFFERAKKREELNGAVGPMRDDQAQKRYPTLVEVLGARMEAQYGETNRCSLSIWLQDGRWRTILKDKKDGTALWLTSDTLAKVFDGLEAALCDENTIWRTDRFAGNGEANRVKKK